MAWRAVVLYKAWEVFHRTIADVPVLARSAYMESSSETPIRTEVAFRDWAYFHKFAASVPTIVTRVVSHLDIIEEDRADLTVIPHLPLSYVYG